MTKLRLIFTLGFFKEAISSLIPTLFVYLDFYENTLKASHAIILALFTFFALLGIMLFIKIREYRNSIARALAYGYYKNFVEKLFSLIESKGKSEIEFIFQNKTKKYAPKNIIFTMFLASSYEDLLRKQEKIKDSFEIVYIESNAYSHPFFVYAKTKDDKIIINEIPRTLFALKYYVDPNLDTIKKIDSETQKYFTCFNDEFKKLWSRIDSPTNNFNLKMIEKK
ncbi:STING domain-containing protein [Algoriphagus sp.]|uniref:STING domain-containing protein n=1 Tax=Algoriphagus sp. TaxID=1872435 RepID=UPI0025EE1D7C|nr:STING domain-containing protein [Algoriphagus sp.]